MLVYFQLREALYARIEPKIKMQRTWIFTVIMRSGVSRFDTKLLPKRQSERPSGAFVLLGLRVFVLSQGENVGTFPKFPFPCWSLLGIWDLEF